ncbi:MAG: hypothetical protein HY543_06405, partial [Deltaproteobacteria bacterium]|nr:hypothetical protein [Deltaproteobacteria bacterium]
MGQRTFGILTAMMIGFGGAAWAQAPATPFIVEHEPVALRLAPGQQTEVRAIIHVPDGHYLYKKQTALDFFALEGIRVTRIAYPASTQKVDPFFGREVAIYPHDTE